MTPQEILAQLELTGPLYTRDPEDVGHISARWRKTILSLCALVDAAPLDAADQLRASREQVARLSAEIDRYEDTVSYLLGQIEAGKAEEVKMKEEAAEALLLVAQAIPRMRSLNNQMSPVWLDRAYKLHGVEL